MVFSIPDETALQPPLDEIQSFLRQSQPLPYSPSSHFLSFPSCIALYGVTPVNPKTDRSALGNGTSVFLI
jgi:hypothetical protein